MFTSVTAEYLVINDGCNGKAVEAIGESLPYFNIITSPTCTGGEKREESK